MREFGWRLRRLVLGRRGHLDRLEAPLECSVLLDVLAVLGRRGRADVQRDLHHEGLVVLEVAELGARIVVDALGGVDALGDGKNLGLNVESAEPDNNVKLAGAVMRWSAFVFLPLIRR